MNPDDLPPSPMETANFLSKIFFSWLLPFFRLGAKRDLELSDLYRLSHKNKADNLGTDLGLAWSNQIREVEKWNLQNKGKSRSPSLRKAIIKVFFWEYTVLGFSTFIDECIIKIVQPILLGLIIRYCAGEFTKVSGYLFGVGLFISSAIYTIQHQFYFFLVFQVGMKIRVACSSLVYRKALKLSQAAIGQTNVGQLVNLLSNDVNRFDLSVMFIHYLWTGPIQLSIATYVLWYYYGWPCFVGVSVLILFVPFQSIMGKLFGALRQKVAERTDKRIRIMSEIVSAVRTIKMYAWELPFAKLVGKAREDEIKYIRKTALLRAVNLGLYDISSKVATFLTLLTYVLTGNYLNAEKVFVALALYNNVRLTMTQYFPTGISQVAEALVSIKRIENFLLLEERDVILPRKSTEPLVDSYDGFVSGKSKKKCEVIMTNLSARWSEAASLDVNSNTLSDISLKVTSGQLLAVVGSVGSGKTSLLQVLLHELPLASGTLKMKGKLAYTCQEPWIFSGSVRDNILFGREYEYERYYRVLEVCALSRDMELLPYRDQTLVGDRGMSLSGGQKARINLARAVYADADVYLLDAPLSAVDAEVAKHIFENCIMGYLKEKARILVTHQLQFLKSADEIIMLNKGKVEAKGSYKELSEMDINFTEKLHPEKRRSTIKTKSREYRKGIIIKDNMEATEINEMCGEPNRADQEVIVKSWGRKESSPLLPEKPKNAYGSFSSEYDTTKLGECDSLLPQQHEETRSNGNIGLNLYWKYISAGSSWFGLILLFGSNILVQLLFSGSDYWLQYWTKIEQKRKPTREHLNDEANYTSVGYAETSMTIENFKIMDIFARIADSRDAQIYIYCALVGSLFLMSLLRTSTFFNICLNSSIALHRQMFHGVMRAAMRFFEINRSGCVLNRFSKDIGIIDEMLPLTFFETVQIALQVVGVVTIVSIINPYLMIPSLTLPVIFYFVRRFYLKTAKSVRHLEAIARSPVFSHLNTSLYGLSTIRAMKAEQQFEKQFNMHQDLHTASWVLFLATAKWLGIFFDWCCVMYLTVVTFTFLVMRGENSGSALGLSIASAMSLAGMLQWGVRQSAETENQMVSVERVQEYAQIEPEGSFDSSPGNTPPLSWPSRGEVAFRNVALKYGDDPPVLKNITCTFKCEEKIGIVGRTGSGKTSLISSLFRITEPCQGDIQIDGVSILWIGLHDLRKKISIIPQDPVLFNSSLRKNLDPFGKYKDEELWTVLEQVYLAEVTRESPAGLDMKIAEGGSNFSVGQRQLICLGRAILRKNKILVLDEATANVDHATDALIQKAIREKFASCTVLTIAHRLHTVMDSDRILVLDAGEIKEFDEPYNLLRNEKSFLSQLVETTGSATAANLYKIAKTTYDKRHFSETDPGEKVK